MPIRDTLLPEFDMEMVTTRKVLERCPEDQYGFKPHEKSWTMAQLATHVANLARWAVITLEQDEFDYAPPGAPPFKEEPAASREELLKKFDGHASAARDALERASDEHLMAGWSLLAGGQKVFTMPRVTVLRSMVMNHGIFHRGQLTVYLRLTNTPVPAIYGPSADEQ